WDKMLKRFGTMKFKEVLEPARKYAVEGFPVHEVLANSFRSNSGSLCNTTLDPDTPDVYCPGGKVPGLYEIFKNPDMGHTFEVLQKKGIKAFYKGEIAQAIVAKANSLGVNVPGGGPFWTMDDLKNYQARWERPLMTEYHGYNIWETPPPSQAWAALEMLNILEVCAEVKPFDLGALGRPNPLFTHIEVEAKKLAYSDLLRWNADPDFSDIYDQIDSSFNNKDYALSLCGLLEGDLSEWPRPDPDLNPPVARPADVLGNLDGGTIFGVSADRWGNMVSFVNSVYTSWGSKVTIPGYGFQLSSRGAMFNFDPEHPNTLAGGKRPFITIISAFITKDKEGYPDGEPIMAFGNMGGGTQPQAHAQHVVNMIDLGFNVQATGDAARFDHDQGHGNNGRDNLRMDMYLYNAVNDDLTTWGHTTESRRGLGGGYQGVLFERDPDMLEPVVPGGKGGKGQAHQGPVNGTYRAGSELRKDGAAVGW
ncbi:MAG: gamma-glutamyltransferase, partial [Candidatus Deferrimicrobiaceae bacterium]